MMKLNSKTPKNQRGVGLIEVLIAVLILSFGMLGVAAMQGTALNNSLSASQRTLAVTQTYAIIDAMRANRSEALIGNYNLDSWTCAVPDAGDLADNDRRNWIADLQANLGSTACGKITCNTNDCLVEVRWDDSRATGPSGQSDWSALAVQTRTRL